jgi:hypothetical protein
MDNYYEMPEASNSNSHGYIHGDMAERKYNAGGVEDVG